MNRTVGVVLTGGASRRMGADKAFVVVGGRPMAIAVADALREGGCSRVECQGGDLAALGSLGLPAVADEVPDAGPVVAIVQALRRHSGPVVVAACDLPALDPSTVRSIADAGSAAGRVAVATTAGRTHLVAWFPPGSAATWGAAGERSMRVALAAAGALEVEVSPAAVVNVNRPDDLAAFPAGPDQG